METERPDALFRDPFARRLAGERGEDITRRMRRGRSSGNPMIVRTIVLDEIILDAVTRLGADMVVNLAAGLDARPWRLPLPSHLRWVDVDFPDMLQYKGDMLRDATPVCRYEAIPTDLTDPAARRALFARLGGEAKRAIVVSEGLLIYLTADDVASLAADLRAVPSFRWWLFDLASPRLLKMMRRMWGKSVEAGNAQFKFGPREGPDFFERFGWRVSLFRSGFEEMYRRKRSVPGIGFWLFLMRFMPRSRRDEVRRFVGYVLLERGDD